MSEPSVHARSVAVAVVRAVSRARALTSGGQSGPGLLVTWSRVTQRSIVTTLAT